MRRMLWWLVRYAWEGTSVRFERGLSDQRTSTDDAIVRLMFFRL